MQGYILKITKVKDEDCIVDILTHEHLVRCYRFYGVRHSNITQGYKIDFELVSSLNFLPKLSGTMHLGFSWLNDRTRLIYWQHFIRLFYEHLREAREVDEFYFNLLDESANKFAKQNPKRIIIESYARLLEFEGRLHTNFFCFLCDESIENSVVLTRAFLPSCVKCSPTFSFDIDEISDFFQTKKSINLSDEVVDMLYEIVLQGF